MPEIATNLMVMDMVIILSHITLLELRDQKVILVQLALVPTVNEGYTGTVREWLASLIGDDPYVEIESNQFNTGPKPTATGRGAIAIGTATNVSGRQSIGLGVNNNITGRNSGAIGNNNNVSGNNTYVLGNNVTTAANNSVVLGQGSTSNRDNTVSVGAAGAERQITNVAAGTQDTDAVNVDEMLLYTFP